MKKKFLSLFCCFSLLFSLAGCGDDSAEPVSRENQSETIAETANNDIPDTEEAEDTIQLTESTGDSWAIYWYLCGSDLESENGCATTDLEEMMEVELPENVKVIIETGGASQWQNDMISADVLGRYVYDSEGFNLIEEVDLANMGDPDTLADFLYFAKEYYTADHTAVLFWNHGGGSLSGAAFDENFDNDSISLLELYSALDAVFVANEDNPPIELLGFDTCLMATVDTANVAKEFAHYLVASEETEPGNGWYYTGWLSSLAENPSMNGDALGIAICSSFYDGCELVGTESDITLSVTDLTKIRPLLEAYEAFGNECLSEAASNPGFFAQFARSAEQSENYGGNNRDEGYTDMVDLGHLARNTAWMLPSAQSVLDALDKCIIYKISGTYRAEATGLSCYYAYDNDLENLDTYESVGASQAFKHLFSYGLTGEMSGETESYLNDELDISEYEAPMSLSTADWEDIIVSVGDDGVSYIDLGPNASDVLASISFYLFSYDEENEELSFMGTDNDLICDWDNGIFYDNFQGLWGCINGIPVYMELTYEDDAYNMYSVPILLNGEEYTLQVSYDFGKEDFVILGARQGMDESGMASKELRQLKNGDTIDIIWKISSDDDDFENYVVDSVTVDSSFTFSQDYLPDGTYAMIFSMSDAFGAEATSDVVFFFVEDGQISTAA